MCEKKKLISHGRLSFAEVLVQRVSMDLQTIEADRNTLIVIILLFFSVITGYFRQIKEYGDDIRLPRLKIMGFNNVCEEKEKHLSHR